MEVKEGGKMIPVDQDRAQFSFTDGTIAAFDVKKSKYTLQATPS